MTRTIRDIDSEVVLSPADGVPTLCAVSLDNILTIRKEMLGGCIATLSGDVMQQMHAAIRFVFAIS